MHAYYIVSYMMQTMHVVSELCYSILTVLIKTWYVFPFCSLFILNRWQELKNLRGLLPSPSWSWCCPIRMQMLRGCFQCSVGLNKTKTRNSLALDGTLSSIMAIKRADLEPCFRWEPHSEVI